MREDCRLEPRRPSQSGLRFRPAPIGHHEGSPTGPSRSAGRRRGGARMGTETRGVVAREKGAPVTLETILVPDPGPGEAVVTVKACGVCHTDLHYREGGINDDFPFLLGHEAAGIVESVGDDVTDL